MGQTRNGRALITLGFVVIAVLFLIYARLGNSDVTPNALSSFERLGATFYIMMILALGAIAYGFYQYHKHKVEKGQDDPFSIIAQVTWNSKSRKIFVATSIG